MTKAPIGTLAVGTRFRTLLTQREGAVREHRAAHEGGPVVETRVALDGRLFETWLHPRVVVRVVEVTH